MVKSFLENFIDRVTRVFPRVKYYSATIHHEDGEGPDPIARLGCVEVPVDPKPSELRLVFDNFWTLTTFGVAIRSKIS